MPQRLVVGTGLQDVHVQCRNSFYCSGKKQVMVRILLRAHFPNVVGSHLDLYYLPVSGTITNWVRYALP